MIYDFLILGQGIAGTTLAWHLLQRGQRVLIVDPGTEVTASRIAAGLITPVTGKRFVISWKYETFWNSARLFYRRIEQETGHLFLRQLPHWHLFQNEQQQQSFTEKRDTSPELLRSTGVDLSKTNSPSWLKVPYGKFSMTSGGQLNVKKYLDISGQLWRQQGILYQDKVTSEELEVSQGVVHVPRLGLTSRVAVFCCGAEDRFNHWFAPISFLPAKGEILTLQAQEHLQQVIHCGVWLAHGYNKTWRAGSTYAWQQLDHEPTASGRDEICCKLNDFAHFPLQVIAQQAAIRPALVDQRPVAGRHPQFPQLAIFNGLGSKGSLQAPWLAGQLADHLCQGTLLQDEIALQPRFHF